MKWSVVLCSLVGAGLALAAFRGSESFTIDATPRSISITNVAQTAFSPCSVEWVFTHEYAGTVAVSRIRSGVTNLLVRQVVTNATSIMMNEAEFGGVWFERGDVLLVEQPGAMTGTVYVGKEDSYEP